MAACPQRELLCVCCSFSPQTSPTANRAAALLRRLAESWRVRVVTEAAPGPRADPEGLERITVSADRARRFLGLASRMRLGKLIELFAWPDADVVWAPLALVSALRELRQRPATGVLVFMMPYSSALVGLVLKRMTGVPLVLNFDDSPTCSDMHPFYPTAVHRWLAAKFEDTCIAQADAVIYVSETTRKRVAARLRDDQRAKLHLIRYGADPSPASSLSSQAPAVFTIRYVGGMNGWHALVSAEPTSLARRVYRAWMTVGHSYVADLDVRGSSPIFVGRAVRQILSRHPEWQGRVRVELFGNTFPPDVVHRALAREGLEEIIVVEGSVGHDRAIELVASAEMLFLTLPARRDSGFGGRISAKTYEYLTTDRPILAAVSRGENRAFLEGHAGVDCCDPLDDDAIARLVEPRLTAFFEGRPDRFDRTALRPSLSYAARAEQLGRLLEATFFAQARCPGTTDADARSTEVAGEDPADA